MKKFLKIFGIFLAVVILIAIGGYLTINLGDIPSYEHAEVKHSVTITPEKVERGKKLSTLLCATCHYNTETGKLTGKQLKDAPPEFGLIYSTNITQHETHGIGSYTDGELVRLLRTGIKKNGQYAPPYMSKLPLMADEDIDAIIAYLRSDDKLVQADPTPTVPCEPAFLTKFLCRVAFKPLPMPTSRIEMPDTNNRIELGKYLALNLECFSCHSADFKTNDYLNPQNSEGFFGGGNRMLNEEGKWRLTQNLTPDKETGIGDWTEEQFVKAVKYGLKDGEPALRYPMLPYTTFTDEEVAAIFAYLHTIPPIENKVERSPFD